MSNYTREEEALAHEIANTLGDHDSIGMHLSYVHLYEEWSLRKELKKVMNRPAHKIYVTRGAYYNSLVQQYGVLKNSKN